MSQHYKRYAYRAEIGGVSYNIRGLKWGSGVGDDLPGRLAMSSGYKRGTASFTLEEQKNADTGWEPWATDYPQPNAYAVVWVEWGENEFGPDERKVFTGKVDTVTTSALGETVVNLVDYADDFSKTITVLPRLSVAPGRANDSTVGWHAAGTSLHAYVDAILSACGYTSRLGTTGEIKDGLFLEASLQGTFVSTTGGAHICTAGESAAKPLQGATFWTHTDGTVNLRSGYAVWRWGTPPRYANNQSLAFEMVIGADHAGVAEAYCEIGGVNRLIITVDASRNAVFKWNAQTLYSVKLPAGEQTARIELKNTGVDIYLNKSFKVQSAGSADWWTMGVGTDLSEVSITATGNASIYQLLVRAITTETRKRLDDADGRRCAVVKLPGYFFSNVSLTPSVREQKALDALEELAKAICACMYFDAEGVFHFESAQSLRAQTAKGDLLPAAATAIEVKSDALMEASAVTIKTTEYVLTRQKLTAQRALVPVWQGSAETVEAGAEAVFWIETPTNEEWLEPDTSFVSGGGSPRWGYPPHLSVAASSHHSAEGKSYFKAAINAINNSTSSHAGATSVAENWSTATADSWDVTPFATKLVVKNNEVNDITMKVPTQGLANDFPVANLKGTSTPVMMAGAKALIADSLVSTSVATTATTASELVHEMGLFGQGGVAAKFAADVAKYCGKGAGTYISAGSFFYNPRLVPGSTWVLDLLSLWGKKLKIMVLEATHSPGEGVSTVSMRIVEDLTGWTYAALEQARGSYAEIETAYTSYEDLETK